MYTYNYYPIYCIEISQIRIFNKYYCSVRRCHENSNYHNNNNIKLIILLVILHVKVQCTQKVIETDLHHSASTAIY